MKPELPEEEKLLIRRKKATTELAHIEERIRPRETRRTKQLTLDQLKKP
jgi:hypothetical protein